MDMHILTTFLPVNINEKPKGLRFLHVLLFHCVILKRKCHLQNNLRISFTKLHFQHNLAPTSEKSNLTELIGLTIVEIRAFIFQ